MGKQEITLEVFYNYDNEVVLRATKDSLDDKYWKSKYSKEVGLFPIRYSQDGSIDVEDPLGNELPGYIPIDVHALPENGTVIDLETEHFILHLEISDDEIISRAGKFEQAYYKNHQQVTAHFLGD
ncbi:MAG: hypothetical protein J5614_08375 [Paludibacteraceae bacterium]|nr:hypothetical protein [Paludibacteraceae bacterium]